MSKQKLVIIGNGMAAVKCVQNILDEDPNAFEITLFGSEKQAGYNRIMLSSVLQGDASYEEIMLNPPEWYVHHRIRLYAGETVSVIDQERKVIRTEKREVPYDKLIIATGSSPFILPVKGADKEGVVSFRTMDDCRKMESAAKTGKKAIVIGGGLLGLEAAKGLITLGMNVQVVHKSKTIMERQLDYQAAVMLQRELKNQGMGFLLEKETEEITGVNRVEGIRFKDGTQAAADLVVMAAGVRPNISLAQESGIRTNRGIVVDDVLKTSSPDIYAVGECAEHNGMVYGLVQPLYEQASVLAKHLCSRETDGYRGSVLSTQLKVSGVEVFSAGQFVSKPGTEVIHYHNDVDSVYKKIVFKGNKAVGAVLYGDTKNGPRLLDVISKQKVLSRKDKSALLETPDPADSSVAAYPMNQQICQCNSVSKGAIIQAVQQNGLSTVQEVKEKTKASGSCGGCKPLVNELLDWVRSEQFDQIPLKAGPICSCTDLTEDQLVEQIQIQQLNEVEEVRNGLNWKTEAGCPTCNLALEYYLEMVNPGRSKVEFLEDKMMNAIPQGDGHYAIIPQLYGGAASSDQLGKITSVVHRYPWVKAVIGSDQRIHLLGVRRKDLFPVLDELNLPLCSPAENRVETIRTDIGNHHCRCDKQSSVKIANALEYELEFLKTPCSIKIGVSSCIHDGAGSTTKDIGAIEVNGKWEIYIGGSIGENGGKGQLLCIVVKDQLKEMILGFIQYYRESARYLEKTWQWIERLGLVHIREVLFDRQLRDHLVKHLKSDSSRYKDNVLERKGVTEYN